MAAACLGCAGAGQSTDEARLAVLVPASERPFWAPIARSFEAMKPKVRVDLVEGPNATDLRENLYTVALLARDESFDLVYMDVTWTPKFAAAGWLVALDSAFPRDELDELIPAAVDAGRYAGRLFRVPVRTDLGLLYYRKDWLAQAGFDPPRTFEDLARIARALQAPPERWGFVWQGSQYEGLVCVFLEILRGHGGFWVDPQTLAVGLDQPPARAALEFLSRARGQEVRRSTDPQATGRARAEFTSASARGVQGGATQRPPAQDAPFSPRGVTTYKEEESRRLFQEGRAVFLRNWFYVWRLAQGSESPIAGKVGVRPMVGLDGSEGAGTLGGWGLGVSRFSRHRDLACEFIRHAISLESQRTLCARTGYAPARREAYRDDELLAANPLLSELQGMLQTAVSRPAIPRYALASDILQRQLSASLAGLVGTEDALRAAARETRLLLGQAPAATSRSGLPEFFERGAREARSEP